jgi:hypothetical protein
MIEAFLSNHLTNEKRLPMGWLVGRLRLRDKVTRLHTNSNPKRCARAESWRIIRPRPLGHLARAHSRRAPLLARRILKRPTTTTTITTMKICPAIASALGLVLVLVAIAGAAAEIEAINPGGDLQGAPGATKPQVRANFKLPALLNFGQFKARFQKIYASPVEEAMKGALFLGRAYRAFISAVWYRYRRQSHYEAINHRSDWLPGELEASRIRQPEIETARPSQAAVNRPPQPVDESDELAVAEERGGSGEHTSSTGDLGPIDRERRRRKKRDISSGEENGGGASWPDLQVDQALYGLEKGVELQKMGKANRRQQATGVRDYKSEPGYRQVRSFMVVEGRDRHYDHLPVKSNQQMHSLLGRLASKFWGDSGGGSVDKDHYKDAAKSTDKKKSETDVAWVDYRFDPCLGPVRKQGLCGSCYAFGAVAFMEWAHCRETGELVQFSPQYIVDCGPKTSEKLRGCLSGSIWEAATFIANFGLEPAANYPYLGVENACPYGPDLDMEYMGYMRANLDEVTSVDVKFLEDWLEQTPLIVNIFAGVKFDFYGGGVYDGKDCKNITNHVMLLIGHGREDGEEYWLLRNSFGRDWGESGNMKLNKNSVCLVHGFIYNGQGAAFGLKRNAKLIRPVEPVQLSATEISLKRAEFALAKAAEQIGLG